jgi:hypothetical protein
MGVGVSALGNGKDQDEKLLDEKMIEEVRGPLEGWVVVGTKSKLIFLRLSYL